MDLSKQTNTSASMYFDAESSASSSAFKTLEAISDISNASTVSANSSIGGNETLEFGGGDQDAAAMLIKPNLVAMKNQYISNNLPSSPLSAFPKNILQEYRAHCSTPTKEQLARTVEIDRGSEASNCIDLRAAFRGADEDDKIINVLTTVPIHTEENKENALPEKSCEVSTLSQSSSVGVVTIIDRNKISTNDSVAEHEEEVKMEIDVVEDTKNVLKVDTPFIEKTEKVEENDKKKQPVVVPKVNITRVPLKARRSLLPTKGVRRSVCEPDLKNNRPSRISLMPQNTQRNQIPKIILEGQNLKPKTDEGMDTEIPKLLTKALTLNQQLVEVSTSSSSSSSNSLKNKRQTLAANVLSNKTERKLMPPTISVPEKRPYQYAQRMSIMVKTTLNSPARKIMRRSMMPPVSTANSAARRSNIPSAQPVNPASSRRSMLPQSARSQVAMAKSSSSVDKVANKPKSVTSPTITKKAIAKISEFKCSVCNAKFSIKSLLDAHKRSHEDGVPAFVRKPAAIVNSNSSNNSSNSNNNNNKCKFCDKKFALLRTLHIHLMQNCTKIPPSEKRKLVFTEMQHEGKAQLPTFSQSAGNSSSASNGSSLTVSRGESTLSSSDAVAKKNKDVAVFTRELAEAMNELELSPVENTNNKNLMAPPSISKVKKSSAHAGVYRTPNKSVPCYICKISFKSVLEYTHHSMQTHGNNNDDDEVGDKICNETAV